MRTDVAHHCPPLGVGMPRLFSSPAIAFIDVLPSARMASITGRMLAAYASAFTLSRAIPSGAAPAPDQRAPLRRVRPRDWDGRDGAGGADHRRDNRGDCRPCRRSVRAFRHSGPPLSSGANPVVTFPITGGSTSSTGDLIEHNGSGLQVTGTNPTTTVDIQIYLVDTGKELVDADSSIDGALQGNIGLFTLGSSGLSNVPLTLTSNAVTALNAAFGLSGMDAFTTSTPIGTLTSSPTVGFAVAAPEPATITVVGVGLVALAAGSSPDPRSSLTLALGPAELSPRLRLVCADRAAAGATRTSRPARSCQYRRSWAASPD